MNILNQDLTEPPMAAGNTGAHDTHRLMLEWKAKYLQAIETQNAMESDIERLNNEQQRLVLETSNLKMERQNQEIEMAHLTKQLINGQGAYMEQIGSLSDEVSQLRAKNRALELDKEALQQKLEESKAQAANPAPIPEPRVDLSQELLSRHEQLKQQVKKTEEINQRLAEENDAFQFLLSENTISGQFPTFDIEGSTLDAELESQLESDIETHDNLKFELKSAQNYIQALKLSLESLVQRLLENRDFEKVMEQTIGSRKISAFTERRRQATAIVDPPKYAPDEQQYWSNLLTPKKRTGGTRTFSMGVDERLSDTSSCSDTGSTLVSEISLPKRTVTTQTELKKLTLH